MLNANAQQQSGKSFECSPCSSWTSQPFSRPLLCAPKGFPLCWLWANDKHARHMCLGEVSSWAEKLLQGGEAYKRGPSWGR